MERSAAARYRKRYVALPNKKVMLKFVLHILLVIALGACRTTKVPGSGTPGLSSCLLLQERTKQTVDSVCVVQVETFDMEAQEPLGNVVVLFTKSATRTMIGVVTRLDGTIERRLKPDEYNLEARFTGKQTFYQAKLTLEAGWRYRLKIGLADNRGEPSNKH